MCLFYEAQEENKIKQPKLSSLSLLLLNHTYSATSNRCPPRTKVEFCFCIELRDLEIDSHLLNTYPRPVYPSIYLPVCISQNIYRKIHICFFTSVCIYVRLSLSLHLSRSLHAFLYKPLRSQSLSLFLSSLSLSPFLLLFFLSSSFFLPTDVP